MMNLRLTTSIALGALLVGLPVTGFADEAPAEAKAEAAAAKTEDPAIQQIDAFIAEQKIDKSKPGWKTRLEKPPKLTFTAGKKYKWELETNQGPIVIDLMPDVAPMHVSSTLYLTRLGFYDDTVFHRVIPGFMAQGGDPLGRGSGGPGYEYAGEFKSSVKHDRGGLLSMANRGPGTDGSQFFLTFVPTPWLDGKHTLFGEVVGGKSTLKKLEQKGSQSGRTNEKLVLEKAQIRVE